jgi:hypothetical protein
MTKKFIKARCFLILFYLHRILYLILTLYITIVLAPTCSTCMLGDPLTCNGVYLNLAGGYGCSRITTSVAACTRGDRRDYPSYNVPVSCIAAILVIIVVANYKTWHDTDK